MGFLLAVVFYTSSCVGPQAISQGSLFPCRQQGRMIVCYKWPYNQEENPE